MTPEKRQTFILYIILIILLIVLLLLVWAVGKNFIAPASQGGDVPTGQVSDPTELPLSEGMSLQEAKALLVANNVTYSIVSTQSRMANTVEKIEYSGKSVKLYANEVGKDKVVYLTFDDGPTRDNTQDILNKLQEYGIKASFFVEGRDVERYPDRMEATFLRGHYIACHSHTHEFEIVYSSIDAFIQEIHQYEQAMIDAIGEKNFATYEKIIRFPGGTNNAYLTKSEALEYMAAVRALGYSIYDWTALTGDAQGASDAAAFISNLSSSLQQAKNNGYDLIVLMHDKWSTNEALEDILSYLISEGYYFDTINHCPEYTLVKN